MKKHDHDLGLAHDLKVMKAIADRRQVLRLLAGASLIPIFGCGGSEETANAATNPEDDGGATGACGVIPEETAGPYPGDGSNGANALTVSGVVRSDIRSSFGTLSGTAEGIPLTIELTLVDASASCAALAGYAIYLWHCDRDGNYSLYSVANQNYLRGVQETDANGKVTFTSIFPACYSGRWPHIHFEVYPSVAKATASGNKVKTSQLALPQDACDAVYATTGYAQSVTNLSRITLASDNVFSDGTSLQVATVTGNVTDGYVAKLNVGISA